LLRDDRLVDRLRAAVVARRAELVELTQALVRERSLIGDEEGAQRLMAERLSGPLRLLRPRRGLDPRHRRVGRHRLHRGGRQRDRAHDRRLAARRRRLTRNWQLVPSAMLSGTSVVQLRAPERLEGLLRVARLVERLRSRQPLLPFVHQVGCWSNTAVPALVAFAQIATPAFAAHIDAGGRQWLQEP